ncbi:MAG: two-component sensor histidine kinase, partial [Rhodobacteraceae bacterium]|nr:two-component sensor histidine kinase [Paracoccaceae bacterium]
MSGQRIKRFLPRGLYGRTLLILVVPVVAIQLVVSVVFIQRHFERVTEQMTEAVVREVALIADRIARAPDPEAAQAVARSLGAPLGLAVTVPGAPPEADRRGLLDLSGRAVIATLRGGLPGLGAVDLQGNPRAVRFGLDTRFGAAAIEVERRQMTAT